MKKKVRIGNLELRTTGEHLIEAETHTTAEIVEWGEKYCWTIAYWVQSNEGIFSLKFGGNRPLGDTVNPDAFWRLAKDGQDFLEKYY